MIFQAIAQSMIKQ